MSERVERLRNSYPSNFTSTSNKFNSHNYLFVFHTFSKFCNYHLRRQAILFYTSSLRHRCPILRFGYQVREERNNRSPLHQLDFLQRVEFKFLLWSVDRRNLRSIFAPSYLTNSIEGKSTSRGQHLHRDVDRYFTFRFLARAIDRVLRETICHGFDF